MDPQPSGSTDVPITPEVLGALRDAFDGQLLTPDDDGYDDARLVWNGMIDRHPGAIARCVDADDVMAAVRVAREHALLLAVRGGGHNVAGAAVCDGGLVIDLSAMKDVEVDPPPARCVPPAASRSASSTPPPSNTAWPCRWAW
jgi:hypothetical protein